MEGGLKPICTFILSKNLFDFSKTAEFFLLSCLAVAKRCAFLSLVHQLKVFLIKKALTFFFFQLTFFYELVSIFIAIVYITV